LKAVLKRAAFFVGPIGGLGSKRINLNSWGESLKILI